MMDHQQKKIIPTRSGAAFCFKACAAAAFTVLLASGLYAQNAKPGSAPVVTSVAASVAPPVAASATLATPQTAPATAAPASSAFVGSDTCQTCHAEIFKNSEHTAHWKIAVHNNPNGSPDSCEGCHGPGQAHVESGGDATKIFQFTKATTEEADSKCLSCHQSSHSKENYDRSTHSDAKVGCLSCHSVHHPAPQTVLLKASQPTLCYSCHSNVRPSFDRPFHHRVNEGLMNCNDCHDPHGALRDKQLRTAATQDQVCIKCHAENAGPFVYEHPPVKTEGCVSCHSPHGSSNPRMLKVNNVNTLCMQCHSNTVNFSAPGTPSFHNQANQYQACTVCHTAIHGSNVSDVFFQ